MNWYLVKLVYRIQYKENNGCSEFDEQLRILLAEDELHAFQKGRLIGEKEEYLQQQNNCTVISWRFIDVCELHKLDAMIDGAEMFSNIRTQDNADMYIRETRKKALSLYNQAVENFTSL